MTPATFNRMSVILLVVFSLPLFSTLLCSADSDKCKSKPSKSSREYNEIIENETNKLLEKRRQLLDFIIKTECSDSTSTSTSNKSKLIKEICATEKNKNQRYQLLDQFITEACRKYYTKQTTLETDLIIDICIKKKNIKKYRDYQEEAVIWEKSCEKNIE